LNKKMKMHPGLLKRIPDLLKFLFLLAMLACCVPEHGHASELGKPWDDSARLANIPKRRPNILFVIADQWRAETFGFAGNPDVKTPNLNQLQRHSVNFINAIAGTPVCCPTRASLMTGQRPLTHGVFLNDVPLATNAVTLAKVLKAAGYDTGYIGKWHLDAHGRSKFIPRERRQGFDYWKVLECTHEYNHSFYYADGPEKLLWPGYDAIAQTEDASQYLRNHATSDKPFLLFVAWGPPHEPYQTAPQKYRDQYTPAKLKVRPNVPASLQASVQKDLAGYYAHCTALDDCLANLRRTLRETGLEENTLLIFTSDHGDMIGSQASKKKQQPYDESNHIPLLLHWPAGLGRLAKKIYAPINSEDIMPTLLGLCDVKIPTTVEGLDFSALMRGGKNPSDGAVILNCPAPFGQWPRSVGGREFRGIRTSRYTYVRELTGPWLLFDNKNDPFQMHNLIGVPYYADLQARLDAQLQQKLEQAHDAFLPADAYIQKWGYKVDATGTVPYTR
jgi:arylsulfatase A-like enzyme